MVRTYSKLLRISSIKRKTKYFFSKFRSLNTSDRTWRSITSLLKDENSVKNSKIIIENEMCSDPLVISEKFNLYFTSIPMSIHLPCLTVMMIFYILFVKIVIRVILVLHVRVKSVL